MSEMKNPWVVRDAKKHDPLPVGSYYAVFAGVNEHKLQSGELRWRWVWRVASGDHMGREASALTGMDIANTTHAGRIIVGLLGKELRPGDDVKALVDACVGRKYAVSIAPGSQGGKASVQQVIAPPPA